MPKIFLKNQQTILKIALVSLVLTWGFFIKVQAATPTYESAPTASEVLVVYNSAYTTDSDGDGVQDSQEIAEYYASQRPGVHLTSLATITTEIISRADYNSQIRDVLESYLTTQGLRSSIKFIVLTKGIPLKISATNGTAYGETDYSSVGAAVCLLYNGDYNITWRQSNPYYGVDPYYTKAFRFDTNHFTNGSGTTLNYLVTRLDGLSVPDIKALINRGVNADLNSSRYWVIDDHGKDYDNMPEAFNNMHSLNRNTIPNPWVDNYYSYLNIIDISDPHNFVTGTNSYTLTEVEDIFVLDNYAYVADSYRGLKILNVSNFNSPSLVGNYNDCGTTSGDVDGVFVVGNYAYTANADAGIEVIDISNPASPSLTGSLDTSGQAVSIKVVGNYAYVADGNAGLKIIDISNPASPSLTSSLSTAGHALDIDVVGNYAYTANADAGIEIIDISNPSSPSSIGSLDTNGQAVAIKVVGNYAYLADANAGLKIIDISNPASPSLTGTYNNFGVRELYISANNLYAVGGNNSFFVLDISNPATPSLINTYNGFNNGRSLYILGNYAYVVYSPYITTISEPVIGYTSHGIHAGGGYNLHTGMGDGWISNDPTNPNYINFNLLNGAVISTYESYNGFTFRVYTGTRHGLVAEWIKIGGSGGIGNVYEPWSSTIARENVWMPEYAVGYTWIESAYMSLRYIDFTSTVAGDPLMTISEIVAPSAVSSASGTVGNNQVALSWINPGDADFAGVKVVRKEGAYPGHSADGTVIYNGSDQSYIDTNVVNGTTYYYAIFAYDEVPNYSLLEADSKLMATPSSDTVAPDSVTGISANPGNHQVILNWINPANIDFSGVKVMRKDDAYSNDYNDGILVYDGAGDSCTDAGLTNDTTYYYTIFAYDHTPNYAIPGAGAKITATPYLVQSGTEIDVVSPGSIYNFVATPGNKQVSLSWTNPTDSDFNLVRVLRRTDYYPQTISDGDLVSNAYNTSYLDSDVLNNTTYFYTAFACDRNLNCSSFSSDSQDYATPCNGSCSDAIPEIAPTYSSSEPDITPPSEITNFQAVAGNGQVSLSWDNPFNDNDWLGTVIVRKLASYPNSQSDGLQIYNNQDGGVYIDTDVISGTTYYYGAFAYDAVGNYTASSTNASAVATPN